MHHIVHLGGDRFDLFVGVVSQYEGPTEVELYLYTVTTRI